MDAKEITIFKLVPKIGIIEQNLMISISVSQPGITDIIKMPLRTLRTFFSETIDRTFSHFAFVNHFLVDSIEILKV